MPISRYEIRNEYSLADPELYRAADKDDPEAFLEGVAMAGLVGVLRQLGDLAEFAAEVFHNLHEDVMATAARGHALSVRVQQLETEIPSIERAFLSQIDHSSFFYHPGIDWHPNLRPDKNLVTQGDLPRFIMDSYEECRAPPRLFLLDKFDVAGAGACLKRYTDPSFFKVETTEVTNADIQREKKTRKTKKKGPRWRNRETPEVIPKSHTKLHQLFLEEHVETGVNTHHAKLKRRLNGFPFHSKTGRSYMENILKSPSPDHKMLHDMTEESPQLKLATNYHEYGSEIYEVRSVSPDRESGGRKRSTPSPDREGVAPNLPMYDPDESPEDDKVFEVPSSYPRIATDGILSTIDKVTDESNREGTLTCYESDDIASEIDNYVDAPSTMESEVDKDSDLRMMSDNTSYIKMESLTKDEKPIRSRSSGSQSTVDSTMSDVGYNSSMKELSSISSDSPSISTQKTKSESFSRKGFPCTDIPVNEIFDASSHQRNADENFPVDHHSSPVVSDDTCSETDAITNRRSESEQVLSSLCSNGSIPPPMLFDTDEVERKCMLKPPESDEEVFALDNEEDKTYPVIGPPAVVSGGTCTATSAITNQRSEFEHVSSTLCINGSMPTLELSNTENAAEYCKLEAHGFDEMVSTLDVRENKIKLVMDPRPQYSPRASIFASQSIDDLSRTSCGEQLVDESNGECETCLSAVHDVYHHATNSSKASSNLLDEDEFDGEDLELADDAASTSNTPNALSANGTVDTMFHVNLIPGKFEDEFPEVTENSLSDYSDAAHNVNKFEPKGDHLMDKLDDEDSYVSTDSWRHLPKGLEGTSLASAHTMKVEDNYSNSSTNNQIGLENLNLSHPSNSSDEGDVIPEEDTTVNETLLLGILEPLEVVGFLVREVSCHVSPNDSEALERLGCTSKDLEEPTGTADIVEMDGASLCSVFDEQEVVEVTSSARAKPDHEIHVLLNKSGSEVVRSKSTDIASPLPPVSDEASHCKSMEEHIDCFEDSGIDGLENEKLELVEKVGPAEASASGFGTIGCNPVDNNHPRSELSGLIPNSHLDLKFDHRGGFPDASKTQSPIEKCGLDREELFEESCEDNLPDAPSLPVDNDTEESVQDKVGLPPSHLNPFLLQPVEVSSELSPLLPINYLQILDNDDGKEESNSVSVFSLAVSPSPPSISELSRLSNKEIYAPGYPEDPLGSSPPNNPFLESNQINLADLPPLPPLPPVQWRMGKLQHALPSTEEETITNGEPFPQSISPTTPIDDVDSAISTEPTNAGVSPLFVSTSDIIYWHEENKDSQTEPATETTSEEQNLDSICSHLEVKTLHESIDHPPKIVNKPQLLARPTSDSVSTSSSEEDGAENGSQRVRLLWPCNPLVDDISFLDKSKLRKVTERVIPEVQKVDERDSLLAQIRTKSFNLKPAMASRPSIRTRGPNTNLKVVAILEKANAIRQAFAGSDEDDDDSWSE